MQKQILVNFVKLLIYLSISSSFGQMNQSPSYVLNPNNDYDQLYLDYLSMIDTNYNPIDSSQIRPIKKIKRSLNFWNSRTENGEFQSYAVNLLDAWQNDYFCHENEDYTNSVAWSNIKVESAPTSLSSMYAGGVGAVMGNVF